MNEYEYCEFSKNDTFDITNSEFIECKFYKYDFSDIELNKAKFIDCSFIESNLSNCNVSFSSFRDTKFESCKMIGINWSDCQSLSCVHFQSSLMNYNIFQNLKMTGASFIDCSLRESDFSQSKLSGAIFTESDLTDVNFNGCDLVKSDFRYSKNFFIDPAYTNIKKAIFSMPEAMNLLKALDIVVKD